MQPRYLNAVRAALAGAKKVLGETEAAIEVVTSVDNLDRALMDLGQAIYTGGKISDTDR